MLTLIRTLSLALAMFALAARASEPAPPEVHPVTPTKSGPIIKARGLTPLDPSKRIRPRRSEGLLARSTVLSCNGHWTIVPKHAVLYVPPRLQERVNGDPGGTLLPWHEFYRRNHSWIHQQPVRMSDARGETSIAPRTLEAHRLLGRVVVAVLKNGPISVRPSSPDPPLSPAAP